MENDTSGVSVVPTTETSGEGVAATEAQPVVTEVVTPPTITLAPEPASGVSKPEFVGKICVWMKSHSRFVRAAAFFVLLSLIATGAVLVRKDSGTLPVKQFTNIYSFVPEKLSMSAAIPIVLPKGIGEAEAQAAISFDPELKGSWLTEDTEGTIVFDPEIPLQIGRYYAVSLNTPTAKMSGDFYVDEDPIIESIFPNAFSETHEDVEITIMFNRPMVPLTTLLGQESIPLPITIAPETKGRFKWLSTRTLQFIPETTLIPSSEYTVTVGEGLVSLDGLPVAPYTHTFTTRPLRYTFMSEGVLGYRSPIVVSFNQPVDLDKTTPSIAVLNSGGSAVPIEVRYGESITYDYETGTSLSKPDRSKLYIYAKEDAHGRKLLWDFNTSYTITVTGAVPEDGNINLTEMSMKTISVPDIVEAVRAESSRSQLVRPGLFDPEGTLVVTFYDDIDKDKSDMKVKGLRGVVYGERCKTDERGETVMRGGSCEKEPDTRTLIFSFNRDAFGLDEQFTLTLERMYTKDGFRINNDPIPVELHTYPQFQILSTTPQGGVTDAALDGMTVCSNVPIHDPGEDGVGTYVSTQGYVVFARAWSGSQYVDSNYNYSSQQSPCEIGQFETRLAYGLLPLTPYTLTLSLTDDFGQTAHAERSFSTKMPEEQYTRFHNMQQQYNVTRPGRTKLTYAAENLEYMDMHLCKLSPEAFLGRIEAEESSYTPPRSDDCTQVITERIELPRRYWVNNYFQVDLSKYFTDTLGHYIITFSNPLYTTEEAKYDEFSRTWITAKKMQYDRTKVSVTNLAVGKKEVQNADATYEWWRDAGYAQPVVRAAESKVMNATLASQRNLYWVNDSTTLTPVVSAVVTQYRMVNKTLTRGSVGFTDAEGIGRVAVDKDVTAAIVRAGTDSAVVTDWADMLGYAGNTENASRTYIYTDRPIYRPGHTVYIRGIDRVGFDGSYEVWTQDPAPLQIFNASGESIYETKLPVSTYGTFNTQFELPKDAPLGTYRIEVFGQSSWFDVEEYVPAAFKVTAATDKEEYISGDTFTLDVQADYYFGVPVSGGTLTYGVTAQDYYFDRYTDEYFNFGSGWYYCYSCGYGDSFLFRGEVKIDENGHARIERPLKLEEYFDGDATIGSKLVTVSATAQDINGRSIATQQSFIVHKGEFYIGATTDHYYTGTKSPINVRVKTVDTNGKPQKIHDITETVNKIDWETFKRQEVDGGFYYRSEKRVTEVKKDTIKTDENGNWEGTLMFDEEGEYEVRFLKKDSRGNTVETTISIYIYGTNAVTIPPNNNYELDLVVERTNVDVGDTASVLIKSPYDHAKVLITAERGTIEDYWVRDIAGNLYLHEFPIKESYVPNIYFSALLLSSDPEVKYGSVRFDVGRDTKTLDVEVTAEKNEYLPGETVNLTVETKDVAGRPLPAEVSLAVVDLSVLALKGNPKKDPLMYFYDGFPLSVSTASNIKNILYEVDIPLGTKGGGGDPNDLATKKRGLFKDTAFWNASVVTDSGGKATATFTLPDNLTTWQIESVGITEDTKVGVDYTEFTTKKQLMAVPLKPRFIVPGDTFKLGAQVFNQTDHAAEIVVKLESSTLTLPGETERTVRVGSAETKVVYFDVVAPKEKRAGEHTFTVTATGDTLVDSVEQSIAITPNTTYETVATANVSKEITSTEYLYVPDEVLSGDGGLTVNANATLAVFMTDALGYMVTYPYGCSEQLASALSTIGTLTKALTLPNVVGTFDTIAYEGVTYTVADVVEKSLTQMYETQSLSGGFAYYAGLEPDLWLTIHVLTTLIELKDAGFTVRPDAVDRAVRYIQDEARTQYLKYPSSNREMVIAAEYALRAATGHRDTGLTSMVISFYADAAFMRENISSMSLAYLTIMVAEGMTGNDSIYATLENRIDIDGRGAYLTTAKNPRWEYYETSIKNTALLLKAIVAKKDEHPQTGNILRWLLASRDDRGVWGSTHNTFVVVDALVDYLKWQRETEAHFNLTTMLGDQALFVHEFDAKNIFETYTHFVPIDAIKRTTLLPLTFTREDKNGRPNNLYYDMSLKYFLPVESIPPRDEGIAITRELFALSDTEDTKPIVEATVGDIVKGKLTVVVPDSYNNIAVEASIPAGFEIVNQNLDTEQGVLESEGLGMQRLPSTQKESGFFNRVSSFFRGSHTAQLYDSYDRGDMYGLENEAYRDPEGTRVMRPTHIESHDDRVFLFVESLVPGVYVYEYYLRALVPGSFQQLPARAEELYFPEVFGRTSGDRITVTE